MFNLLEFSCIIDYMIPITIHFEFIPKRKNRITHQILFFEFNLISKIFISMRDLLCILLTFRVFFKHILQKKLCFYMSQQNRKNPLTKLQNFLHIEKAFHSNKSHQRSKRSNIYTLSSFHYILWKYVGLVKQHSKDS